MLLLYRQYLAIFCGALCLAQQDDPAATTSTQGVESGRLHGSETSASAALPAATSDGIATCPSRTANYITHTLPQQCLRTDRTSSNATQSYTNSGSNETIATGISSHSTVDGVPIGADTTTAEVYGESMSESPPTGTATPLESPSGTESASSTVVVEADVEGDSPLDNAKFLSFEEWKKQNLAKPPEQARDFREHAERQRPGINNALDGFGEDGEIDLDFSGFGTPENGPRQQRNSYRSRGGPTTDQSLLMPQSSRSKDAGKTCKERTNYASFDCAATVVKNNPECKSASSVLVENKDSYMLNTCSAENKFFIVELCDLILIDTIVLANYEFFSSIFRHFRVSASDSYPVKMEKWKDLGTYEARNTREVQAFLIEHPQIWARYLRIEFLTHYGSEYFCPVSLLRVHGTTMLEDMRAQEETSQGDALDNPLGEDLPEETPAVAQEPVTATYEHITDTVQAITSPSEAAGAVEKPAALEESSTSSGSTEAETTSRNSSNGIIDVIPSLATEQSMCPSPSSKDAEAPAALNITVSSEAATNTPPLSELEHTALVSLSKQSSSSASTDSIVQESSASDAPQQHSNETARIDTSSSTEETASQTAPEPLNQTAQAVNASWSNTVSLATETSSTSRAPSTTASAPAQPQPSTQESFFKSIHKRLQQLESNSTLSLQYIEEQSRILRDAFSKVEKRQISATTSFLKNLNETVMQELHGFRQAYDQLWQSTVLELEGQREQYQREMLALSSRLTLVADELVWQKRMGIVQSTLLLLCLGLVLFARGGNTNAYLEVPLMQQMMNKSTSALGRAGWESPPASPSPGNRSPVRLFRRKLWRSVTEPSVGTDGTDSRPESKDGPMVVGVDIEPPTPPSVVSVSSRDTWDQADDEAEDVLDPRQSQSGPATPRGTREMESMGDGILVAG